MPPLVGAAAPLLTDEAAAPLLTDEAAAPPLAGEADGDLRGGRCALLLTNQLGRHRVGLLLGLILSCLALQLAKLLL